MNHKVKILQFKITCGETTCAVSPGVFCEYTGSKSFGTKPWCLLFQEPLFDDGNPSGWLKRSESCLNSEVVLETK